VPDGTGARALRIGVLALQGDVREHVAVLARLGAATRLVRTAADLDGLDGLVIPGGESTVMDKLTRAFGLAGPLRAAIDEGVPVYGTCAGLIMVADRLSNPAPGQRTLGGLDVTVERNAFGSQTDSFEADLDVRGFDEHGLDGAPVHAVFIRAPVIESSGPDVRVLATVPDGRAVAARQGGVLATSFHPEMTGETRFHEYFLAMAAERADIA